MTAIPDPEFDLVVRGGTVVTAGGQARCDVAVRDGLISQLGGSVRGRRELDARGALVLPGGIDLHVHLSVPDLPEPGLAVWADDFDSGTAAAAAGGITTIGNMTFPAAGDSLTGSLDRDLRAAREQARVDYLLHPVLAEPAPAALAELPGLARAGHTSVKLFMVAREFDTFADEMVEAVRIAGQHGMLTLIHCEDGSLVRHAGEQLVLAWPGRAGEFRGQPPVAAERSAVARAVSICEATGSPVCVVHLSSQQALAAAAAGKARGLPFYVETRPLYLYLTSEALAGPDGARYIGAPPLRSRPTWPRCGPAWRTVPSTRSAVTTRRGGWPTSWTQPRT